MNQILDLVLHLQDHLNQFTQEHGLAVYFLLFGIVFCETGLVIAPFLPGDSLLLAVGAIAASPESGLNIWVAGIVLVLAAFIGDSVNYWIGRRFGEWAIRRFPRLIQQRHIDKSTVYFQRYGGKTIILARFIPVVRTFAPFVAGSGCMDFKRFMIYNLAGALLWVGTILPAGWFFGNIEVVKQHFEIVVIAIVTISVLPVIFETVRARLLLRAQVAIAK